MGHKCLKAMIRKFWYGIEDKQELEGIKPMIADYNYKMLRFCSATFSVTFLVILLLSVRGVSQVYEYPFIYVGMSATSALIYLLTRFVFKKDTSGRAVLLTFYGLQFVGYIYGYYTGIIHGPFPAVTFIVMIIILPSLLCDCPYRGNIIMVVASTLFLLASRKMKAPVFFSNDVVNVVSYFLVSLLLNTHQQMCRMEDFTNRRIIKIQRDTDSMTGTMTKAAFESNSIAVLKNEESEGCLLVLDVDNFKSINDSFGHSIGDFFIANTGRCLRECCRSSDFVGRFGGDEFVILMKGPQTKATVEAKVKDLTDSLKNFFMYNTKYKHYSISVGCALFQKGLDRPNYQQLFDQADHALYVAKNSGKDRCVVYGD